MSSCDLLRPAASSQIINLLADTGDLIINVFPVTDFVFAVTSQANRWPEQAGLEAPS